MNRQGTTRRRALATIMGGALVTSLAAIGADGALAAPTVLMQDGFESGTMSAWTSNTGMVVQQSVVDSGLYAARAQLAGSGASASRTLSTTYPAATVSFRLNVQAQTGTTSVNFSKIRTSSGTAIAEIFLSTTRKLGVRNDYTGVSTTSTVAIPDTAWHTISFGIWVNGTSSTTTVSLDGTPIPALAMSTDLGTTPVGRVQIGENLTGRTADLVFDSVAISGLVDFSTAVFSPMIHNVACPAKLAAPCAR